MLFRLRKNGTTRFLFRVIAIGLPALLFSAVFVTGSFGQELMAQNTQVATPLAEVLREAEQNNPQIRAARQGWEAAKQVPSQVSTLPDPQFQCSSSMSAAHDRSRDTRTATSPTSASASRRIYRIPENCD